MKRLLLLLMIFPLGLGVNAQLTGLEVETVIEHTGMVGTTDLTGYTVSGETSLMKTTSVQLSTDWLENHLK
jgi:hypothetical protein